MLYLTFLTFYLKLANTHKKQSFPRFLLPLTVDGDKTVSDIDEFLPGIRITYIIKTPVGKFATHLGETLGDDTGIGQVGRQFQLLCKVLAERCAIIKFAFKIFDIRERHHNQGIVFLQRNSLLVYHLLQGPLYSFFLAQVAPFLLIIFFRLFLPAVFLMLIVCHFQFQCLLLFRLESVQIIFIIVLAHQFINLR